MRFYEYPGETPEANLYGFLAVVFGLASYPLFFSVIVPAVGLFLGVYALRLCRDNVRPIAAITLSSIGLVYGLLFWILWCAIRF